jgi:transcription initiation factor IIE alpha subunit
MQVLVRNNLNVDYCEKMGNIVYKFGPNEALQMDRDTARKLVTSLPTANASTRGLTSKSLSIEQVTVPVTLEPKITTEFACPLCGKELKKSKQGLRIHLNSCKYEELPREEG